MSQIERDQQRIVKLAHEYWGTQTGGAYRQIIESLAYAVAVLLEEKRVGNRG